MFIVLLKFSDNKAKAAEHMAGHNAWLQRGFEDGVFLLAGGIKPGQGGVVLAEGRSLDELQQRVAEDPFVAEDVVTAEILDIQAARADERLQFLLDAAKEGAV